MSGQSPQDPYQPGQSPQDPYQPGQPPQDPYQPGQPPQDPYQPNPYGQSYPQGYNPQHPGAYAPPRQPLDLGKVVAIGAWVVLALFVLKYLYALSQDELAPDFADRFFGGLPELGTGVFYTGVLHGVALWMERQRA